MNSKIILIHRLIAVVFYIIISLAQSNSQSFHWTRDAVCPRSIGFATCVDQNNNTYVTGQFSGIMTFSSTVNLISQGGTDIFIAKYNINGGLIWARRAGSNLTDTSTYGTESGLGICIDPSGFIMVTGRYNGTANFGNLNITSTGLTDIFVARYSPAGNISWVKSAGGTGMDEGASICSDQAGNVYITGTYFQQAQFNNGGTTINCGTPYTGVFAAKYSNSGSFLWVKSTFGGNIDFHGSAIAYYNGQVLMGGTYSGLNVTIGSITLPNSFNDNGFIATLNSSNGSSVSYQVISSIYDSYVNGICIDGTGSAYITGYYYDSMQFGTFSQPSYGNNDLFVAKMNVSGIPLWLIHAGSVNGYEPGNGIAVNINNEVFVTGSYFGSPAFGSITLPFTQNENIYTACYNSGTGSCLWAVPCPSDGVGTSLSICVSPAGSSNAGTPRITGKYGSPNLNPSYTIFDWQTFQTTNQSNFFVSKLLRNSAQIRGVVFRDYNNNGIKDASEPLIPNTIVKLSLGSVTRYVNTDAVGNYSLYVPAGSYTGSIPFPPLYYTRNPNNFILTVVLANTYSRDLGLYPQPNKQDLKMNITCINRPRPGFICKYALTYENVGTIVMNGNISSNFTVPLIYSASTPPGTVNGNNILWTYSTLQPGDSRTIFIEFAVPVSAPLGTPTDVSGTVNPVTGDLTQYNNDAHSSFPIRGSWDPNDKAVDRDTIITPQQIANGDSLTYTIRFQNTGTAEAIDITVLDSISTKLDLGTIQVINASHPFTLDANQDGVVRFNFQNILLPDSNSNEPASHGFITYMIKPRNDLVIGDIISNTAYIYFDFNAPVVTNTTFNIVNNLVGTGNINQVPLRFALLQNYPNPFNPKANIKYEIAKNSFVRLSIYDISGRFVETLVNNNQQPGKYEIQFDGTNMASGVYFYKLEAGNFTETKKMIIIK